MFQLPVAIAECRPWLMMPDLASSRWLISRERLSLFLSRNLLSYSRRSLLNTLNLS
jgi:hypothetical protein